VKACGECNGIVLCLLLKLVLVNDSYMVEPEGLLVKLPLDTPIDEKITRFLKYTDTIRSRGGRVEFYIGRSNWPGVYGVACKDAGLANAFVEIPEPEETMLFEDEGA
jgi:hypothetical protein